VKLAPTALARRAILAAVAGELTPAEILHRARWVYATCLTYQDRGEVVARILPVEHGGLIDTTRMPFSTAFVRPDRFRFEWAEAEVGPEVEWERALILWNAEGVRSSWSLGAGVESHETVHAPIGAFTGVSDGSAYTVPTLLIPGGTGRDSLKADGFALRGRAVIGDRECYELHRSNDLGTRTLWLGCADFLLRRVFETCEIDGAKMEELLKSADVEVERDFPTFRDESTTTYEPIVDAPIDPERFEAPAEWPRAGPRPRPERAS
jgi:hypothetical protein